MWVWVLIVFSVIRGRGGYKGYKGYKGYNEMKFKFFKWEIGDLLEIVLKLNVFERIGKTKEILSFFS